MAMGSANKRSSAIAPASPWRGLWPLPDGTVGAGDRAQANFMYRGIIDGAGFGDVLEALVEILARRSAVSLVSERLVEFLGDRLAEKL